MRLMVTGGAGYIGSHTVAALLRAGHAVTILDNLANSRMEVLERIEAASGRRPRFVRVDLNDRWALADALSAEAGRESLRAYDCVLHLAGLKSPPESVSAPLEYFRVNICGTVTLLEAMREAGVNRLVYSSSASVYGPQPEVPIREDAPTVPANPYGQSKLAVERIIAAVCAASDLRAVALRYFNPVGADASGKLGEDPLTPALNLVPRLLAAAAGRTGPVSIYGTDYPTLDGTCVRDFVHVTDLADGHVAALASLEQGPAFSVFNLGTGRGHTVRQVVQAVEAATGHPVPTVVAPRRVGDPAVSVADSAAAARTLGWRTAASLEDMCRDAWRWDQVRHVYPTSV